MSHIITDAAQLTESGPPVCHVAPSTPEPADAWCEPVVYPLPGIGGWSMVEDGRIVVADVPRRPAGLDTITPTEARALAALFAALADTAEARQQPTAARIADPEADAGRITDLTTPDGSTSS
jgi:hypothetical protein